MALFLALKAYFWLYFQLERFINDPQNRKFGLNNCSFWPFLGVIFDHFSGLKSRFLDFFKVVLESLRKFLRIV